MKIGIIGIGNISKRHRSNLKELYPNCHIIGMSSSGRELAEEENIDQAVKSIDELIELEPKFVIISSPSSFHYKHAEPLLKSNVNILIEKPLLHNSSELADLMELYRNSSSFVRVAYCLRFMPAASFVRSFISEREDLISVSMNVGQYLPAWRKETDYRESVSARKELGGGVLLELSHEIDLLKWFFPKAELSFSQLRSSPLLDTDVEDIADLNFSWDSGTAYLHMDFLQKQPQRKYTFNFVEGRLEWDLIKNEVRFRDELVFSDGEWKVNQMYLDMLEAFDKKDNTKLLSRVDEAADVLDIIEKAKESA